MPAYVQTLNTILALGTILLQASLVFILCLFIFRRKEGNSILIFLKKKAFLFIFLLGLSGLVTSLFYSDVIGFPACDLCWKQRFFIYPQVLVFGFLLSKWGLKFKRMILSIGTMLAIAGSLVSIFHIYIENGGSSGLACSNGSVTDVTCSARYVFEFGYVTIPVMALTVSLAILLLLLIYKYTINSNPTKDL